MRKLTRKQQLAIADKFAGIVSGHLAGLGPEASKFLCVFARKTFRAIQTMPGLDTQDFLEDLESSRAFLKLPDIDKEELIKLLETFGPTIAALLAGKVVT
jgi:hypothetical protein